MISVNFDRKLILGEKAELENSANANKEKEAELNEVESDETWELNEDEVTKTRSKRDLFH